MAARSVLDVLVASGTVSLEAADAIKKSARETGENIETLLIARGVDEEKILEAKSQVLGIPARKVAAGTIPFDVLGQIPEESARHYEVVPIGKIDGALEIGMVNPESLEAREALQFISSGLGTAFQIYLITRSAFNEVLKGYQGLTGEVSKALGQFTEDRAADDIASRVRNKTDDQMGTMFVSEEEAPVTKMVTVMLKSAIDGRASDVHIEPGGDKLRVRFRVDGDLHTSILLPMNVHEAIVSRVKIMTNMKIDEKRIPQDGRFKIGIDNKNVDFRVSTFPTYFGEKVVIRILDSSQGVGSMEALGYGGRNLELMNNALKRPYGLILITGPTGSGKSTTLYAMLQKLNDEKRNIISLEDPIEYYISGINQSQVRPEINYTFASGLRSVLRQDPDVIMVGEIRDKETAQLAIHAALTGHLVLSTLHTNNAVGVIPRLIDMGVDPFLIPSTLVIAVAQRLARTLCADSRKEVALTGKGKIAIEKELEKFPVAAREKMKLPEAIFEAKPSPTCPKGTKGRTAINEVLEMTPELEEIVLKGYSESAIQKEAERQGMLTLKQDGILKVLAGTIGMESLLEVA